MLPEQCMINLEKLVISQVAQARYMSSLHCNSSDLHIYKGLYGERNKPEKKRKITKNPLEPKLHQTALNQLKNHTAHKESGAGIQVSGFYCNSFFFGFTPFPIQTSKCASSICLSLLFMSYF